MMRHALHVASAVLLAVFASACASLDPDPPVSTPETEDTQPAVKPATPVAARPTTAPDPSPARPTPATPVPPAARAAPASVTPQAAASPVVAPSSSATPATLDLKALTAQLKATNAIGVFSKLSLKNKVDDLLQQFREHYDGKTEPTMAELRQRYNLLMMKVLSLVQDDDQQLASDIVASREAIWRLLANRTTFAALQS